MGKGYGVSGDDGLARSGPTAEVLLAANPERRLIRPGGSFRHIDFHIRVEEPAREGEPERPPLNLALVLDRSGSMVGQKLATAKKAALGVLSRLDERDRVAVVVFDDRIDILQRAMPVSAPVKDAIREALARVQARGSTALHEGWLTGCRAIANEVLSPGVGLGRCFLLTDGLANVGQTDPEAIATEAAGVREHAGIGTSTFGIGADYDEGLLGPLAVAGGGQFHHLRGAEEIARTFAGELGEMLAVVAGRVTLELDLDPGVSAEVISAYWASPAEGNRMAVAVGDLLGEEERHVVVRFHLPPAAGQDEQKVRARLTWLADGAMQYGDWHTVRFHYATDRECDAEQHDRAVMHWVGLHHAERAKNEAVERNQRGDLRGARQRLAATRRRLAMYAEGDSELEAALREMEDIEMDVAAAPMMAMQAKELRATAQRFSRGQRDLRRPTRDEE